jgi:hypothetical protein
LIPDRFGSIHRLKIRISALLKAVDKWGFGRWEDVCSDPELPFMKTLERIAPPPPPISTATTDHESQQSQPQPQLQPQPNESSVRSVDKMEILDPEKNQLKATKETKSDVVPTSSSTTNTTTTATEIKETVDKDEGIHC